MEFIRFAGTINTHEEKKVAKATVNVILEDCTGTFYITDIMFQEGKWLSGYVVNNLELLQKNRVNGEITPVRFFNGIVRSGVTAVITNDGEVSLLQYSSQISPIGSVLHSSITTIFFDI